MIVCFDNLMKELDRCF